MTSSCASYRADLLGMLDDRIGSHLARGARDHLDGRDACRMELSATLLTSVSVSRSLRAAAAAQPPDDAWPRLRTRILRQRAVRRPGREASPIVGLAVGAALAMALLVPIARPDASTAALHEAGIDPAAIRAAGYRETQTEVRELRARVLAGKEASSDDDVSRARVDLIRQEVAPVTEWRDPPQNPPSASALWRYGEGNVGARSTDDDPAPFVPI